jgi:hypothetical protein
VPGSSAAFSGGLTRPGVSGSNPLRIRARTSWTVPRDTSVSLAISLSEASGRAVMNSAARFLPSMAVTGRRFPSRPRRLPNCGLSSADSRRMAAIVFALSPVAMPIARSDQSGCQPRIRFAPKTRSARESGRPCSVLAFTARIKASLSVQSMMRALMVISPRCFAASNRCVPSIMRKVFFCTRIGGSSLKLATSDSI